MIEIVFIAVVAVLAASNVAARLAMNAIYPNGLPNAAHIAE